MTSTQEGVKYATRNGLAYLKQDRDILETKEQDVKEVSLNTEDPDVKVLVGTNIPKDIEQNFVELLKSRTSTFARKHEDMTACPKDPFPLPHIDSMVDATACHEMLTFMDASSGFQKIQMELSDQEDTAFMTPNRDLRDAFDILYQYNMKLNPSKCHFGVGAGKFLGYMVTKRGIGASPEQIKAIINLNSPANTKDKDKIFEWEEKHEQALKSLKEYLSSAPLLMKPEDGEPLSLYLAVFVRAYSRRNQCVLRKPEISGRMANWSVKLSSYDLKYEPRTAIKSQSLADFVTDFSSDIQHEAGLEVQQLEESKDKWTLFTDGASNVRGTGLGILLKSPQGDIIPQTLSCEFQETNNEAEYEALITGLQLTRDIKIRYLQVTREDNAEDDALANLASALKIQKEEEADVRDLEPSQGSWILPIKKYLKDGEIPSDEKNHKAFRIRVSSFIILHNVLYRKSFAGPYLRCLEDPEAHEVLKDIHEVRKLPKAPGGKVFMLAMKDYFSKWVEAEAFIQVREKEVSSFLKRNILTRFGIPEEIVCDNGSQFIEMVISTARTNHQTPETNDEALAHDLDTVDILPKFVLQLISRE
ncbi:hypothetical protein L1987_01961 [Smallanthus sonchifolius]|uniref:Uncharacterized protein n=1 Tax=Smallanthus sonchifolius TaxID=185202 RepID=A0ACB9K6M4_9ASTR|nr:hypothetical protein L1987_01961 [Smallanthus sonchifolius]